MDVKCMKKSEKPKEFFDRTPVPGQQNGLISGNKIRIYCPEGYLR
jgi:hypothetical protein